MASALTLSEAQQLALLGTQGELRKINKKLAAMNTSPTNFYQELVQNSQLLLKGNLDPLEKKTAFHLRGSAFSENLSLNSFSFDPINSDLNMQISLKLYPRTQKLPQNHSSKNEDLEIKQKTAELFFDILLTRLEIPLKERSLILAQNNLNTATEQYNLGLISFSDWKLVSQKEKTLQNELSALWDNLSDDEATLKDLLGLEAIDELKYNFDYVFLDIDQLEIDSEFISELKEPYLLAEHKFSELKKQKNPQIDFNVNLHTSPNKTDYTAIVEVSQNLFNPNLNQEITKAQLELQKQEILFNENYKALTKEVNKSLDYYKRAQNNYLKQKEAYLDSEEMLSFAQKGLSLGLSSQKEVKETLLERDFAFFNLQRAHIECTLAYLTLLKWDNTLPEPAV